jgi:hypothetical protein
MTETGSGLALANLWKRTGDLIRDMHPLFAWGSVHL